MKKLLVTSLLGLSSLIALASCGNQDNGNTTDNSTTSSPTTSSTTTKDSYQVSVKYEDGTGVADVRLQFCDENGCYSEFVTTNANGVAIQDNESILAKTTDLIVHINKGLPEGYTYDMNGTTVSKSNTSAVLTLHPLVTTEHVAGTRDNPAELTSLGYYKTCLAKDSITWISFTISEAGTYEVETYDDILSPSDTAINISSTSTDSFYDNNGGKGKNAKVTFEGVAGVTYTIAIQQQGTSTEEDFTFSILKK